MIRTPYGAPKTPFDQAERQHTAGTVQVPAPRADRPGTAEVPAQQGGTRSEVAALVVARGADKGSEFPLAGACTVLGRHRDCDIVLGDVTVSRYHTEIHRVGDQLVVADAGSLNGTYLNRHVVDRAELSDGDEIWVGKVRFTFRSGR